MVSLGRSCALLFGCLALLAAYLLSGDAHSKGFLPAWAHKARFYSRVLVGRHLTGLPPHSLADPATLDDMWAYYCKSASLPWDDMPCAFYMPLLSKICEEANFSTGTCSEPSTPQAELPRWLHVAKPLLQSFPAKHLRALLPSLADVVGPLLYHEHIRPTFSEEELAASCPGAAVPMGPPCEFSSMVLDEACKQAMLPAGATCEYDMPGESPFGWIEGWRVFVHSLGQDLNNGRLAWYMSVRLLKDRLRLVHAWRALPDGVLDATPITRPIFILGMPRTGSTFLYNLLNEMDFTRMPLQWEYFSAIPGEGESFGHKGEDHALRSKAYFEWLDAQHPPEFQDIHRTEYDMASECVMGPMSNEFDTGLFAGIYRTPLYTNWTFFRPNEDREHLLRFHRRVLKFLHLRDGAPDQQWVLKAPWWAMMIDLIEQFYPDARFVFMHRNPEEVVISYASMMSHRHGIARATNNASTAYDKSTLGALSLLYNVELSTRMLAARRRWDGKAGMAERIFDVTLPELKRDPVGVSTKLMEHFGLEISEDNRERLRAWLASKETITYGKHRPTLEEFGVSREWISENAVFKDYCSEFKVPGC